MRIIHTVSWSPSEIESYRQLAFGNVLDGMRELLIAMRDELHIDVANENVVSAHAVCQFAMTLNVHWLNPQATLANRPKHPLQRQGG
jgi:hypothetical protein